MFKGNLAACWYLEATCWGWGGGGVDIFIGLGLGVREVEEKSTRPIIEFGNILDHC